MAKIVRKMITLSPEKEAELARVIETIDRCEKKEFIEILNRMSRARKAALVTLQKTCNLIRVEREKQGLSLADMSERSGIARAAICRLENLEDANPTVLTLNRLADALGKKLVVGLVD